MVEERANGEIPSPIIGTLLTFNPGYLRNPVAEYYDGFTYKYSSLGSEKAKGEMIMWSTISIPLVIVISYLIFLILFLSAKYFRKKLGQAKNRQNVDFKK